MAMVGKAFTACALSASLRSGYSSNPIAMPDGLEFVDVLSLYNPVGSGLTMRIYRIRWLNSNTGVAVTGTAANRLEVWRTDAHYEGAAAAIIPWVWDRDTLPLKIMASCNASVSPTVRMVRTTISTDEYAPGAYTYDEAEIIPDWNVLWTSGIDNDDVQPLTCPEGYGVTLRHVIPVPQVDTPVGIDAWMDFTLGET